MESGNINSFFTRKIIFIIILAQTLTVLLIGTAIYCLMTADKLPANVYVGETQVGGMDEKLAADKLLKVYESVSREGYLELHCRKDYRIKLSDIDAVLDIETILAKVKGYNSPDFLYKIGMNLSNSPKRVVQPAFKVNNGKLGMEIGKLSDYINQDPVNADISLKGGKLTKSPESSGVKLVIEKATAAVSEGLKNYTGKSLDLEACDGVLQIIEPRVSISDFEDAEAVLSTAEIEIKAPEHMESAGLAAQAVDKILLQPLDKAGKNESGIFSFNKCLQNKKVLKDKVDQGYDLVASAVYQAALKAGIKADSITRGHSRSFPGYTKPGLDACVSGDGNDLGFGNTTPHKILIIAGLDGNKVIVNFIGRNEDIPRQAILQTKVVQKFSPPLVREENSALLKGETRIISRGKDGLKVDVLLNGKLLYTDSYDPVQVVIQIGPGTITDTEGGK